MRKILIILDGVADKGDKTSLSTAKTPNLDWLARHAECGMMYPIPGVAPESGAAQFTILGYPTDKYPGRGPLEALGLGIRLKKNEIAFRVNFARFKGNKITDIRVPIPSKKEIAKINKIHPDFKLYPSIGYRGVLVVKNASPNVSNTHPGYRRVRNISTAVKVTTKKLRCTGDRKTASKVNNFLDEVERLLKNRTLILRGAGSQLPKVKHKEGWNYMGDMPVEKGIAALTGMKNVKKEKDVISQVCRMRNNVYLQIKDPDPPGHHGEFKKKVKAIERVDKQLKPLRNLKNTLICITADHATPPSLKRHSKDPVPFLIFGKKNNGAIEFSEKECRKTKLSILGEDLMSRFRK